MSKNSNITQLPEINFDFKKAKRLYREDKLDEDKQLTKTMNYVNQYYFKLGAVDKSMIVKIQNNKTNIVPDGDVYKELKCISEEVKKAFEYSCDFYELTSEVGKPIIHNGKINTFPQIQIQHKTFNSFSDDIKQEVYFFLEYLKHVWASDKDDHLKKLCQWTNYLLTGKKNEILLFSQSEQGTGKSTYTDFLKCILTDLCVEAKAKDLLTNFNSIISEKTLLVFEEMSTASKENWFATGEALKSMATNKTVTIEKKHMDPRIIKNTLNIIINSNYKNCIPEINGRRIWVIDIPSDKKVIKGAPDEEEMKAYWTRVHAFSENREILEALYAYFVEYDTSDYDQRNVPETKNKILANLNNMSDTAKFIKDEYVLKNKGISKMLCSELFNYFQEYNNSRKQTTSIKNTMGFSLELATFGIKSKRITKGMIYDYTSEELKVIASKFGWINEYDDFVEEKTDEELFYDDAMDFIKKWENVKYGNIEEVINAMKKKLKKPPQQPPQNPPSTPSSEEHEEKIELSDDENSVEIKVDFDLSVFDDDEKPIKKKKETKPKKKIVSSPLDA